MVFEKKEKSTKTTPGETDNTMKIGLLEVNPNKAKEHTSKKYIEDSKENSHRSGSTDEHPHIGTNCTNDHEKTANSTMANDTWKPVDDSPK